MGRQFRFRTAQNVLSEIEELVEKYNVDHLVFEDDVLTLKRDRTIKICEGILKLKKPVSWYCLSRVDAIDLELATLMKESGCRMINFGIESGSPEILRTIHKNISLERAEEAIGICNKVGLRTQGTFIVGFPDDTYKTMQMTLDVAKRISPTIAIFFPLTPYPGTEIYDKYFSSELKPKNVNDWKRYIVTSVSNGIKINKQFPPSFIRKISAQWTWKYYFRVSQIFRLVKTIKSWNEIKYIFRSGVMLSIRMMRSVFLR